jgi:hypothetical protein
MALFLLAFAYPSTHQAPRNLPIAVAGPAQAVAQIQGRLDARQDGAFDVIAVADRDAAVQSVLDRDAYGAIVLGPQGPAEVLTASAASPVVAQLLGQLAEGLTAPKPEQGLTVTDVAPTPAADPRGAGLAAGSLPLTIGGILTGTLMALLVRGARRQLAGTLVAASLAAVIAVAVLHGWLGSLDGNVWAEAAAVGGGVAAIALVLIGMHALLGRAGLVIADLALVLIGNPLSAATSAPELLPTGWSTIGHWMPLGATIALASWTALGLSLLAVASLRKHAGQRPRPSRTAPVAA